MSFLDLLRSGSLPDAEDELGLPPGHGLHEGALVEGPGGLVGLFGEKFLGLDFPVGSYSEFGSAAEE